MIYKNINNKNGFTLIEIMLSMAVMGVIVGLLFSFLITQRKYYYLQEDISEMTQNTRAAIDMIASEIAMAGYNPLDVIFEGIPYNSLQLQIYADLNGNGLLTDPNENIIYTYNTAEKRILRNNGGGDQPLAENIHSFTFEYLDAQGNVTTLTDEVRQIRVTIVGQTGRPDPLYTENSGYRTYTLISEVTPRNLIN
jgi:prepilin-type N-terminal cleavage/methylation domain-containing protein